MILIASATAPLHPASCLSDWFTVLSCSMETSQHLQIKQSVNGRRLHHQDQTRQTLTPDLQSQSHQARTLRHRDKLRALQSVVIKRPLPAKQLHVSSKNQFHKTAKLMLPHASRHYGGHFCECGWFVFVGPRTQGGKSKYARECDLDPPQTYNVGHHWALQFSPDPPRL